MIFYNKNGEFLKEIKLENLHRSVNEIKIDKFFFNGLEDYGTFHVYHILNNNIEESMIISNRCYTGFSKKNLYHHSCTVIPFSSYTYINNKTDKKIYSNIIGNKILKDSVYKYKTILKVMIKQNFFYKSNK